MTNNDRLTAPPHLQDHGFGAEGPLLDSTGEILWDPSVDGTPSDLFLREVPDRPSRAWFVGEGPVPTEEPTDADGLALMRAQADELPLIVALRAAFDLIGDGLRLTSAGKPYVADVKKFVRPSDRPGRYCWGESPLEFPPLLRMLHDLGWVRTEERTVLPIPGTTADDALDAASDGFLDTVRAVVVMALRAVWPGQVLQSSSDTVRALHDALCLATTAEGVVLPVAPRQFAHCRDTSWFLGDLLKHPRLRDVPLEDVTGHVSEDALRSLSACRGSMHELVERGVAEYCPPADHEDTAWADRFTAPLFLRGVVAELM